MIKNPSYSGVAKIAENPNPGMKTTRNPHAVNNVNVKQGPKTGNNPSMEKRSAFVDGKQTRAPLADVINNAYAARGEGRKDHVNRSLEGIMPETKAKFRK
jgi:hypothetical protein